MRGLQNYAFILFFLKVEDVQSMRLELVVYSISEMWESKNVSARPKRCYCVTEIGNRKEPTNWAVYF